MKYLIIVVAILFDTDISKVAKINGLKKKAEEAYKAQQFEKAIQNYAYLLDSMAVQDEEATLNLAHSFYQLGDLESAQKRYQQVTLSKNQKLKSLAYQQLGALSKDPQTLSHAKSYFKESIKSDPSNEDARYNYELVCKKLKDQENENQQNQDDQDQKDKDDQQNQDKNDQNQQDQQNKEQQDQSNQNKENQDGQNDKENQDQQNQQQQEEQEQNQKDQQQQEGEQDQQNEQEEDKEKQDQQNAEQQEGEENEENQQPNPSTTEKLQEMNLTEEKARMILEALKNSEVQYIQQNRRRPTEKKDSSKPDW